MKKNAIFENRVVSWLLSVATLLLIAGIFIAALKFPVLEYDVWWYHLPFAGLLHDVNDFREKFGMVGFNAERYRGFPKLMNWIQGLAWSLTGQLGGLALPNVFALIFYIGFCWSWFRIRPELLLPALLCVPLVAIHVTSAYVDLAVNIAVAIQFLSGILIVYSNKKKDFSLVIIYLLSTLIAGNSKFTSTLSSLAVGIILIGFLVWLRPPQIRQRLGILLASLLLASISLLNNTITLGNPFYPIDFLGLPATENSTDANSSLTYTKLAGPLQGPVEWALSITELDWKIRGVTASYNILSYAGDNAMRGGKGRTGGCWGGLMVINFSLLLYFFVALRSKENFKFPRNMVGVFLVLIGISSFLPHSLKMRFYLYIPILLLTINAYILSQIKFPKATNRLIIVVWLVMCFSWLTNPGIILDQWSMRPTLPGLSSYSMPLDFQSLDSQVVARIQAAMQHGETEICLPDQGEGGVGEKASAYALFFGRKGFRIIQGSPDCPSNL